MIATPKAGYERITPAISRNWLKNNTSNRPIRRARVDELKAAWTRGEYRITHQGIAFGIDGVLQDGQHRLTAIAEMPDDFSVVMLITRGLDENAFEAIDIGLKRSASDVLRENPRLAEVARTLAHIYLGRPTGITPTFLNPFIEFARPHHDSLKEFCPAVSRTWSAAPVRSAAVISMASGVDPDYVKLVYRALVHADFSAMPPSAQLVFRASISGSVRAASAMDLFCRCLRIFRPENANLKVVKVVDTSAPLEKVRTFLREELFDPIEEKKTAATSATAKKFKQANYRIAGL